MDNGQCSSTEVGDSSSVPVMSCPSTTGHGSSTVLALYKIDDAGVRDVKVKVKAIKAVLGRAPVVSECTRRCRPPGTASPWARILASRSSLKMSPVLCRLAGICSGRNASNTGRLDVRTLAVSSSSSCTTSLSLVQDRSVSFGRGGAVTTAVAGTTNTIVDDSAPELPPVSASSGVAAERSITISSVSPPCRSSSESISMSPLTPADGFDFEPLPMRKRRAKWYDGSLDIETIAAAAGIGMFQFADS
uniref:Uncharacterized protein n=1 Tax=Anopheles culicifacies TaxID=139723 RepID=A0A182MQH1_9DIPT